MKAGRKRSEDALRPSRRRRVQLWWNRHRFGYGTRGRGWHLRIIVPARVKTTIRVAKYVFTVVGLVSAFIAFGSPWIAFAFGLVLFAIGQLVDRMAYSHAAGFIHAMPTVEMDPHLWTGISFGEYVNPATGASEPALAMGVTDPSYAFRMRDLVLKWTGGTYDDVDGNVKVSIVTIDERNYIFLCYPNPGRPVAKAAFEEARADLRSRSLEDVVTELLVITIIGKCCYLSPESPFPQFVSKHGRARLAALRFGVPVAGGVEIIDDIPAIRIHEFRVVRKADLTRKDTEFEAIRPFEAGGEWQGPPESRPT